MHMKTVRFKDLALISLGIMAAVLTSCGNPVKQADALVTEEGEPAGMVVEYSEPIDKNSLGIDTFNVPGWGIRRYFVSNNNPLKRIKGEKIAGGGRYVILFLQPGDSETGSPERVEIISPGRAAKADMRIKQVAPVTTISGKVIKPWKKDLKAKEFFAVDDSFLQ